jgi:hypothetical protein
MINYKTINKNENVMVCYSEFTPPKGVTEYQVMIQQNPDNLMKNN